MSEESGSIDLEKTEQRDRDTVGGDLGDRVPIGSLGWQDVNDTVSGTASNSGLFLPRRRMLDNRDVNDRTGQEERAHSDVHLHIPTPRRCANRSQESRR